MSAAVAAAAAAATAATTPTGVTYQWLAATRLNAAGEAWAVMAGETAATLTLPAPRPYCERTDCGRVEGTYRCVAGPGWAVDVCNTGGCTRVAAAPAIRRPPAAKWQTRWMLSAGCRWAD